MPIAPAWRSVPRRHRGFALLIVLWTLVLVAFIVAQGVGGEITGDAHLVRPGAIVSDDR
jgi:hypothetical protein